MHAIVFSFVDLVCGFIRGERGWLEVDATRRVEEHRDYIDAGSYLSGRTGAR